MTLCYTVAHAQTVSSRPSLKGLQRRLPLAHAILIFVGINVCGIYMLTKVYTLKIYPL